MKKLPIILACTLLLFSIAGCNKQNLESLGKCPVEMQTVTNKDSAIDTTYTLSIPRDWQSSSPYRHAVEAIPPGYTDLSELNDDISLTIGVRNYSDDISHSSKDIQQYKDLFENKTEKYQENITKELQDVGVKALNFQFKVYKGTHGRIAEVKYTYNYEGKDWNYIYCFREDIPYYAVGGFDDSKKFSSGEVIPWVADSLQVSGTAY
jgi:hypothetical protein